MGNSGLPLQHLLDLCSQLLNSGGTGARYRLVGINNNTLDRINPVQWIQGHYHLNSRAVRISDNSFMPLNVLRIDLRHHQRNSCIHSKSRAVINDHGTFPRCYRREITANLSASREEGNVYPPERIGGSLLNFNLLVIDRQLPARRAV